MGGGVGGWGGSREAEGGAEGLVATCGSCRSLPGYTGVFILNTDEEAENKLRTNTGFDEDSGGL